MGSILLKDELIENVVKKHGYKKSDVEEVLASSIDFLHHLIKTNHVNIHLPFIGNLYFASYYRNLVKYKIESRDKNGTSVSEEARKKLEKLEHLHSIIFQHAQEQIKDGTIKFKTKLVNFKRPQMMMKMWTCRMNFKDIEKIQNER